MSTFSICWSNFPSEDVHCARFDDGEDVRGEALRQDVRQDVLRCLEVITLLGSD